MIRKKDVHEFLYSCLHRIISTSRDRIPQRMAEVLHGQQQNVVVHMDSFFIGGPKIEDIKNVLFLEDDVSGYEG